jgi:hypothetical protein
MRSVLVSYDLNKPRQNYGGLISQLKTYHKWWHHLDSTWLLRTEDSHLQVRDALAVHIDSSDELLVVDITDDPAAWRGFGDQAASWLLDNLW